MMKNVECVYRGNDQLQECPVWNEREQALYWVDCTGSRLSALAPVTGTVRTWTLPEFPGSFAFREQGGILVAFRRGLAFVDLAASEPSAGWLPGTGIDFGIERFNDGACDRRGRFWAGTFDRKIMEPLGGLYRIGTDASVCKMDTGVKMSNGIAWSPDNRTMYFTDTRPGYLYAYDFDLDDGAVSNRRVFQDYSAVPHGPDGCAMDADGCLWVAEVNASRVARYRPDGRLDSAIELPVSRPSSVAFGGSDLRTMFITTLVHGLSRDEQARQPLAGSLLAVQSGVQGLSQPRFKG